MTARPSGGKDTGKRQGHRAHKRSKPQRDAKSQRNKLEKSRRASHAGQDAPRNWRRKAATDDS